MDHRETEIKLRVDRPVQLRRRLRSLGAALLRSRHFEDNFIFDFPDRRLGRNGSLLRIRLTDGRATLTYKGPGRRVAGTKARRELESSVGDGKILLRVFNLLGFRCVFRYQKYRTIYQKARALITLDETPIGVYLEIEAQPTSIRSFARKLGYGEAEFITATYFELFKEYRRANGGNERDMKFGVKAS